MGTASNRHSETGPTARILSSRRAFGRVREAFAGCRDGEFAAAYADARWRTVGLRAALSLVDRVLPMTPMVQFVDEVSRLIRERGLAEGCAAGVRRLGLDCEFVLSKDAASALRASPVLVYGNHPTVLTPFLLAAAARREDVRLLMLAYVRCLIPSIGPYLLPLQPRSDRDWVEYRRGGLSRVVARRLARAVFKSREGEAAKLANLQSLREGARHVARGGCTAIFPGGGGRDEATWYPGVGQIARELRASSGAREVFLLPAFEEARSEAHVYAGLRRLGAEREPERVRVRFGEPRRLVDLVDAGDDAWAVTARLQADFRTLCAGVHP